MIGIDISTWQGRMDFEKAHSAGASFVYIRAGSVNRDTGALYADFQFPRNKDAVKDSSLAEDYGFYWFLRVNQDPVRQADYFTELIAAQPYTRAPICDAETADGVADPNLVADRTLRFMDRMEQNGIRLTPDDVYTRTSYWNIMVAKREEWKRHGLHIARYVARVDENDRPLGLTGPWSDGKFVIRDWPDWDRWQYIADGDFLGKKYGAESYHIDMNLERTPDAPPDIPPSDDPLESRVTALEGLTSEQGARLLAVEAKLAVVKEAL